MAEKKRYKKDILKEHKNIVIFSTIVVIITLAIITQTLSKYILKQKNFQAVVATKFYFESNLLNVDGKDNNFYNWDGKSNYDIEFDISNFEDELRYDTQDISYTINIENNSGASVDCFINGEQTNNGVLIANKKTIDKIKLTIKTESEITDKVTFNISVTSKSPYSKILTGTFNVNVNQKDYDINLIEEKDYEKLIIATYNYNEKFKIKYDPEKLMLYTDNLEKSDDGDIFKAEKNSNYKIEFIKLTTNKINLGTDIIVEEIK